MSRQMSENGIRLHPDTLRALHERRRGSMVQTWLPWTLIVILMVVLLYRM